MTLSQLTIHLGLPSTNASHPRVICFSRGFLPWFSRGWVCCGRCPLNRIEQREQCSKFESFTLDLIGTSSFQRFDTMLPRKYISSKASSLFFLLLNKSTTTSKTQNISKTDTLRNQLFPTSIHTKTQQPNMSPNSMQLTNTRVLVTKIPQDVAPNKSHFRTVVLTEESPVLRDNEVLVQNIIFSLDPCKFSSPFSLFHGRHQTKIKN